MAGSEEIRTTTQTRRDSRFYRKPPGLGWLLSLLLVPLLLGAIGYATRDKSADVDLTAAHRRCHGHPDRANGDRTQCQCSGVVLCTPVDHPEWQRLEPEW